VSSSEPLISKSELHQIAEAKGLSNTEFETLWLMLKTGSSQTTADTLGTVPTAVRNRMREAYRKFGIVGAGPGKLAQIQRELLNMVRSQPAVADPVSPSQPLNEVALEQRSTFNLLPKVDLIGRKKEKELLEEYWQENVRLFALLGFAGIGKTALAIDWVHQVKSQFQQVIWLSLDLAPPLSDSMNDPVEQILQYLQQHSCLLIIDHYEAIFAPHQPVGSYRSGYANYGTLIETLITHPHQSRCLITSAEKPAELVKFESPRGAVRSIFLSGLDDASAHKFWLNQGLEDQPELSDLTRLYQGNPGMMQRAASNIKELFNGQAAALRDAKTQVFGSISNLCDASWQRLSDLEQEILYCLVLASDSLSYEDLEDYFWFPPTVSELLQTMAYLQRRYLLMADESSVTPKFKLAPIVAQYATQQLAQQLTQELLHCLQSSAIDASMVVWLSRLRLDQAKPSVSKHPMADLIQRQVRRQIRSPEQLEKFIKTSHDHGFQSMGGLEHNVKQLCQVLQPQK
jgi:DNA-binding CsgD family transcriptional regulator